MNWKKIGIWTASVLLGLCIVVGFAITVMLHSPAFHRFMLGKMEQLATESLGTQVEVQEYALHLGSIYAPRAEILGIRIASTGTATEEPLLTVDRISAGVRVDSFLRRKWNLTEVAIDRPIVRLIVREDGTNNLPKPKPSDGKSETDIFDLAIRHVVLQGGEVYYNDLKTPMTADLRQLRFQSAYDEKDGGTYSGDVGYKDGHLKYGAYMPLPHDLETTFAATRAGLSLDPAVLRLGESRATLHAKLQDYAKPVVNARYNVDLAAGELREVLKNPSLPSGTIRLAGTAAYRNEPNRPLLETLSIKGDVSSTALRIEMPNLRTEVRDVQGRYVLADGNANLVYLRAKVLGGELNAKGSVRDLSGAQRGQLQATLASASAPQLAQLGDAETFRTVSMRGTVDATAEASWVRGFERLVAKADATFSAAIRAAMSGVQTVSNSEIPVTGAIHADINGARKTVTLNNSYIRTPRTNITMNGTMAERSSLRIHLQSNDLHELEMLADVFRKPEPGQPAPALGLYGTATFDGTLTGSTANPQLRGVLSGANLRARNTAWRQLRTSVSLSPSTAHLQNGTLTPATQGNITFEVQVGLKKWAYTPSSPMQIALRAQQLSLADLQRAANQSYPASGTLNANINVRGTQLNPVGQGVVSLTNARIQAEPIDSVTVRFEGTGDEVRANLEARIPAGTAQGNVTYFPKNQGYEGTLRAVNIQLDQLQSLRERQLDVNGVMNLTASGRGTVKDPQMQADLRIPELTIQKQVIRGVALVASVANRQAKAELNSEVANTYLRAKGTVALTGDYYTDATLDTQGIPLQPLIATYAPEQAPDISGQTELHATLKGPLKKREQLEAHANIPVLRVKYKEVELAAVDPIRIDYARNVISIQRASIRGTGTDLQIEGSIPVDPTYPARLLLLGTVNLELAQIINPDLESSGQIRFNINSISSREIADVQGQIEIVNAKLLPAGAPVGLDQGNGVLTLKNRRLEVTRFTGKVGGGDVTAQGALVFRPSVQFNLAMSGKNIRFVYGNGVRTGAEVNLAFTGTPETSYLRGQVQLQQVSFTPDFDMMEFVGQFGGASTPPAPTGVAQNINLDIAVQSTRQLNLVSRSLSLQGSANLRVTGTVADPVILGRANLTNGDLILLGNRYLLQGGTIDFVNPVRTEPVVNLTATTTIDEYNINLRFRGPADRLQTTYTSDPALPPVDIINLLALGKTTEAASTTTATPGNMGAQSVLASGIASQVTGRLEKIAGISQLSIDPALGGGQQNNGPRVAIKQRVTGNLFVTFATDLTSTQSQQVKVEYRITPRWSVSAVRDQNGGFGFDARNRRDF